VRRREEHDVLGLRRHCCCPRVGFHAVAVEVRRTTEASPASNRHQQLLPQIVGFL